MHADLENNHFVLNRTTVLLTIFFYVVKVRGLGLH